MRASAGAAVDWDYSALAATYEQRPDYHSELLNMVFDRIGLGQSQRVCDIGAGTGKLTRWLCRRGSEVIACEPNAAMRAIGAAHPDGQRARWLAATGEAVPLRSASLDAISYGSSFNVLDSGRALDEAQRLLKPGGHWLALWNHRDLDDPLQREVEALIHHHLPDYHYGSRRQDPTPLLRGHGGYREIASAEARFQTQLQAIDWLAAWRSHATLQRQAGPRLPRILQAIEGLLRGQTRIEVPYFTRLWWARTGTGSTRCR